MFCSTGSEVNMHIFLFRNCVLASTVWEANKLPVAKKRVSLQLLKNCLFTLNYRVMPLLFAFHSPNITQLVVDTGSRDEIWWSPYIEDVWIARMPATKHDALSQGWMNETKWVDPGGLGVIILASGSEVRGYDPGRGRWIFSERKNPEYDFLRNGSKAVGPVS